MTPINQGLRFGLELAALVAIGNGAMTHWGLGGGAAAIVVVLVVWAVFNVPGDPSRSGHAPIPVPGWLRLIIEVLIFAAAFFSLGQEGLITFSRWFGIFFLLHYLASWQRILWLLRATRSEDED